MPAILSDPKVAILGPDPPRMHRINANSFQQHALVTANGWQYAALWAPKSPGGSGACSLTLGRRNVDADAAGWEFLTFGDYEQTVDDGHNTISIGVCLGDGTVHLSFDHHCDRLKYRHTIKDVLTSPSQHIWDASLFTPTQSTLPGLPSSALMDEVSYPRFIAVDSDLLFSYRIGQAGLGSDILLHYASSTHTYTHLGTHLTGVGNSPYANGLDHRLGRLHVSWTYRRFVEYEGVRDPGSTAHKAQAGPNGPENNYSMSYMYSDDAGRTWRNSAGREIARLDGNWEDEKEDKEEDPIIATTVLPSTQGIKVFDIPVNSGILNQEGQVADWEGGFHVLNREKVEGRETWMVYSRSAQGAWKRTPIPNLAPTETGSRGSICVDRQGNSYAILPGNMDSSLTIMRASRADNHEEFEVVWQGHGYDGEPLVDGSRLESSDTLSVFTRTGKDESGGRKVVILDFDLSHVDSP